MDRDDVRDKGQDIKFYSARDDALDGDPKKQLLVDLIAFFRVACAGAPLKATEHWTAVNCCRTRPTYDTCIPGITTILCILRI